MIHIYSWYFIFFHYRDDNLRLFTLLKSRLWFKSDTTLFLYFPAELTKLSYH